MRWLIMTFGKRITMLREEKNMSRKDVAKALNISYSSIAKYETDDRFPDQETLKAIADFFQVSTDYLLGRTSVRNFYEKAEVEENDFVSEGMSCKDLYSIGLPDEVIRQINDYIEFMKQKYKLEGK